VVVQDIAAHLEIEAFPLDRCLPQVEIGSDGGQMRELFRRYLRRCGQYHYQIQDCTLTRIRHRAAARCILQYNLRLVDSVTGRERIQWVTGAIYPEERAKHIWQKLRNANLGKELSSAFQIFEPVSFIPELKMIVQLFPYDRRLPALPLLATRPSVEIKSLFLARLGPGRWYTEAWDVEPIRYRAGLAAVLQYTLQARDAATGRREKRRFYAKIYRDEKGEQIYKVLQGLSRRSNNGGEHLTVASPIAYLSDHRALFQEEASGTSFQEILLHGPDREVDSAARRVARAIAALHLDHISSARHHLVQDEIATLEKTTETLQWAGPHLKEKLAGIVRAVVANLKEVPLRPAHLDLKTDHVLLDQNHCTLLDLDSFALADPVLDTAHILAQIFGLKFRPAASEERLRMAARAFGEEYFNHVPGEWRSRLVPHYAGAALKVALGFFGRQEPNWRKKVDALVEEAKASPEGRTVWRDL
jgi:hypothetical protein